MSLSAGAAAVQRMRNADADVLGAACSLWACCALSGPHTLLEVSTPSKAV